MSNFAGDGGPLRDALAAGLSSDMSTGTARAVAPDRNALAASSVGVGSSGTVRDGSVGSMGGDAGALAGALEAMAVRLASRGGNCEQ